MSSVPLRDVVKCRVRCPDCGTNHEHFTKRPSIKSVRCEYCRRKDMNRRQIAYRMRKQGKPSLGEK